MGNSTSSLQVMLSHFSLALMAMKLANCRFTVYFIQIQFCVHALGLGFAVLDCAAATFGSAAFELTR